MSTIDELLLSLRRDIGSSNYATFRFHPGQQQIYDDRESKEILLACGNRYGKTTLSVGIIKGLAEGTYAPLGRKLKRYTVCFHSEDNSLNLTIIIPKMIDMIPRAWLDDNILNAKSKTPTFSVIKGPYAEVVVLFKSGEMDTEKLAGNEYHVVLIDESITESHFSELKARTVSVDGVILVTYTMVNGVTWLWDYFQKHKIYTGKMIDNPHLNRDVVDKYAAGLSDEERKIRVEGEILDLSGLRFLTGDPMITLRAGVRKPTAWKRVSWTAKSFIIEDCELHEADLLFWAEEFDKFDIFTAGIDVASGGGKDSSVIDINRVTDTGIEQVCLYRSNTTDIPRLTKLANTLLKHFNIAVTNVDITGLGISVLSDLVHLGYPNIASRENPEAIATTDSLGFKFTATTRSVLLSEYRKALQKGQIILHADQTVGEINLYQWIGNRFNHIESHTMTL